MVEDKKLVVLGGLALLGALYFLTRKPEEVKPTEEAKYVSPITGEPTTPERVAEEQRKIEEQKQAIEEALESAGLPPTGWEEEAVETVTKTIIETTPKQMLTYEIPGDLRVTYPSKARGWEAIDITFEALRDQVWVYGCWAGSGFKFYTVFLVGEPEVRILNPALAEWKPFLFMLNRRGDKKTVSVKVCPYFPYFQLNFGTRWDDMSEVNGIYEPTGLESHWITIMVEDWEPNPVMDAVVAQWRQIYG